MDINGTRLYTLAIQADSRLDATITSRLGARATRWTLTATQRQLPEIRAALEAKYSASDAWLAWMRAHGPQ